MSELSKDPWRTTSIALKWCTRTTHEKWRQVGLGVLQRGLEQRGDVDAGRQVIAVHGNRHHRALMERCLEEDTGRFWDLVYKYWRPRGPHDGVSRESIDLAEFREELE
ncbi:MAG: hypothetical protein KDC38_05650 [Planctomycetes bacterium]|nr:hypothetical protein [Planctomycetota bacterium]